MISIEHEFALLTLVHADRERHVLSMAAARTGTRGVRRGNFQHRAASFFRFRAQCLKERRPRRICDAFRQLVVLHQVAHHQRLHRNQAVPIDEPARVLLHEVLAAVPDALMDAAHLLSAAAALLRPLLRFREPAIGFCQRVLFLAKEARVVNLLPVGEVGKGLESHIDANVLRRGWQRDRFHLVAADRDVPLASRTSLDDGRPGDAFEGAMLHQFHVADFGEHQLAVPRERKAALVAGGSIPRERQASIAGPRAIAGVADALTRGAPPKKGLESQVHALDHVLQHLGVDFRQLRAHVFARRQLRALLGEPKRDARHAVGVPSLLQCRVISLASRGQATS